MLLAVSFPETPHSLGVCAQLLRGSWCMAKVCAGTALFVCNTTCTQQGVVTSFDKGDRVVCVRTKIENAGMHRDV